MNSGTILDVLQEGLFLPVYPRTKKPAVGMDWPNKTQPAAMALLWHRQGFGIALQCARHVIVDLDDAWDAYAERYPWFLRTCHVFRRNAPERRKVVFEKEAGQTYPPNVGRRPAKHLELLLNRGRTGMVMGQHTSGAVLMWNGLPPQTISRYAIEQMIEREFEPAPRPSPLPPADRPAQPGQGLDRAVQRVMRSREGQRNHDLFGAAMTCGRFDEPLGLTQATLLRAYKSLGGRNPDGDRQILSTIEQGWRAGQKKRRQ